MGVPLLALQARSKRRAALAPYLQNILLIGTPASTRAAHAALSAQDNSEPSHSTSCGARRGSNGRVAKACANARALCCTEARLQPSLQCTSSYARCTCAVCTHLQDDHDGGARVLAQVDDALQGAADDVLILPFLVACARERRGAPGVAWRALHGARRACALACSAAPPLPPLPCIPDRGLNTTSTTALSASSLRGAASRGPYTAARTAEPSCDHLAEPSARASTDSSLTMVRSCMGRRPRALAAAWPASAALPGPGPGASMARCGLRCAPVPATS